MVVNVNEFVIVLSASKFRRVTQRRCLLGVGHVSPRQGLFISSGVIEVNVHKILKVMGYSSGCARVC